MEKFFALIVLAVFVEAAVTFIREMVPKLPPLPVSIVIGMAVTILYNLDALALFGVTTHVPYVGAALTGFFVARGSNYIYDKLGWLTKADFKQIEPIEGIVIEDDVKEYNS